MANDALRALCETWTSPNGELELLMLPFTSMRANAVHSAFIELVPREKWQYPENAFIMFYVYVIDCAVHSPSSVARIFSTLWEMREQSIEERWAFFKEVYNDTFADLMAKAFNDTRDHTFDGPLALLSKPKADAAGNPPDPKALKPTRRRSKAS